MNQEIVELIRRLIAEQGQAPQQIPIQRREMQAMPESKPVAQTSPLAGIGDAVSRYYMARALGGNNDTALPGGWMGPTREFGSQPWTPNRGIPGLLGQRIQGGIDSAGQWLGKLWGRGQ